MITIFFLLFPCDGDWKHRQVASMLTVNGPSRHYFTAYYYYYLFLAHLKGKGTFKTMQTHPLKSFYTCVLPVLPQE